MRPGPSFLSVWPSLSILLDHLELSLLPWRSCGQGRIWNKVGNVPWSNVCILPSFRDDFSPFIISWHCFCFLIKMAWGNECPNLRFPLTKHRVIYFDKIYLPWIRDRWCWFCCHFPFVIRRALISFFSTFFLLGVLWQAWNCTAFRFWHIFLVFFFFPLVPWDHSHSQLSHVVTPDQRSSSTQMYSKSLHYKNNFFFGSSLGCLKPKWCSTVPAWCIWAFPAPWSSLPAPSAEGLVFPEDKW